MSDSLRQRFASPLIAFAVAGVVSWGGTASSAGAQSDDSLMGELTGLSGVDFSGLDPFADEASPLSKPAGDLDVTYDAAAETVQVHVANADLLEVLRMLSIRSRRNIVAGKDVTGTITCDLYDVTVPEALSAILRSHGYIAREEGNFIFVHSAEQLAEIDHVGRAQETRVFKIYHITPDMASKMIEPALSEQAAVSVSDSATTGIGSSQEEAGGDSFTGGDVLVVRDFAENLDEVARVLDEVDERPAQVLVEATILSTSLNEANELGIDFNAIGGVDFAALDLSGSQLRGAALTENSQPAITGGTGQNLSSGVNGGLRIGYVRGDIAAFVAALETVTNTTVLANPKVLALNKQRGEVLVGREDGYLTTTVTETSAVETVEFLETGTKLVFRPYISRDGYVRLEIHPEDSQGGLNANSLPFKTTTQVTSNVMVKDGKTIVIGGLFREASGTGRSQVPILGNLPWVGGLFRRQADTTQREEIIILLTPHVVRDLDRYHELSQEQRAAAERIRVGTRRGMMNHGRLRMSQANYQKALAAREKGKDGLARFYVNAALHLNPTFIEAIELKEELTGEAMREADQSSLREFLRADLDSREMFAE